MLKGILILVFNIGDECLFEVDFRFGFIVLVEIGVRVLLLLVNDLGIVISIIGSYICLLIYWLCKENNNVNYSEKKDF